MESGYGKLINFKNTKNLELIGLLFETNNKKNIVIHVHGNYGNFYNNKFIWVMSKVYINNNINFLSFNLSAHDGLAEGYRNGILDYIGGAVANYNESIIDIESAVKYAIKEGYKNIILQGHSLGCDKVIDYIISRKNKDVKLILLSPVDSYAVQQRWLAIHKNETLYQQVRRLESLADKTEENELEWVSIEEYGAEGLDKDWIYKIPVTRGTLLSILKGSAFKYLNLECGDEFHIDNPTYAYLGKKDGLQMSTQAIMKDFLQVKFSNIYVEDKMDSDHDIIGVEQELSNAIASWINDNS